jgi:hypothetical protein
MPPEDARNKIAELEKELNAKEFKPHVMDDVLTRKDISVPETWDKKADATAFLDDQALQISRHQKMKKFAKISLGFFVVAVVITGIVWWRGTNIVSGDNINVDISAPVEIAGGEPFQTTFLISNKNNVSIDSATLLVEYPAGFYSVTDKTNLPRISKDLGAIAPGQSVSENVNTILYGEQNTSKQVTVTLEYRLAGSNARLNKVTTYAVKILSSPVNVGLGMLKEASSGQRIDLTVDVGSNSKDPLGTLLVTAEYPFGFTFESSDPVPTYNSNTWVISNLAPQEKRTIKIHGTIEGSEKEEKITKINVGTQRATDEQLIDTVYNATSESMIISKPFIGLDLAVDNDHAAEHVVTLGRSVRADVYWQSNNPTRITDAVIEVKLRGEALNRYLIYASSGGFYRSADDTIVWDSSGTPALGSIEPGSKGSVSFGFSPVALSINAGRVIRNPQIILEVRVRAKRYSDRNVPEDVTTFASRKVKFETDLRLTAKGLYYSGPFTNTGPLPPTVEKLTTYTIALSARNASNDVSNVVAKTTLPIYVKWLGKVSPPGEDVSYDQTTNEVTWNIGRVPTGGARDVAFQISFLPSLSQLRSSPLLTGPFLLIGNDDFTKSDVQDTKAAVTTYLSSDPRFAQPQATVVD